MGYRAQELRVPARTSAHDSERDTADEAARGEFCDRAGALAKAPESAGISLMDMTQVAAGPVLTPPCRHKPADLPWPRRLYHRACKFCGTDVTGTKPGRAKAGAVAAFTVCAACQAEAKCSRCGAAVWIVVASRPPETRLCADCFRGTPLADDPVRAPAPVQAGAAPVQAVRRRAPRRRSGPGRSALVQVAPAPAAAPPREDRSDPLWWTTVRPPARAGTGRRPAAAAADPGGE
jgi:hypothetical protein